MDRVLQMASRALVMGDPLAALDLVALRTDALGLALRGTAMAQLGMYDRADELLRRALTDHEGRVGKARCTVALAEIDLARRELTSAPAHLEAALETLEAANDDQNAALGRLILARRYLALGRLEAAEVACSRVECSTARLMVIAELVKADIAIRQVRATAARSALTRAERWLERARVPALQAELEAANAKLVQPVARLHRNGADRRVTLAEVEALFASEVLVVDGCRRALAGAHRRVSLARRPVLFQLMARLAHGWPDAVHRDELIAAVFGAGFDRASDRVKLRVEIGRLRTTVADVVAVEPASDGYRLEAGREVVVLSPPYDGPGASILALLSEGATWRASALAAALAVSHRTVQRTLKALEAQGVVVAEGQGRARRWNATPLAHGGTPLLLPWHGPSGSRDTDVTSGTDGTGVVCAKWPPR